MNRRKRYLIRGAIESQLGLEFSVDINGEIAQILGSVLDGGHHYKEPFPESELVKTFSVYKSFADVNELVIYIEFDYEKTIDDQDELGYGLVEATITGKLRDVQLVTDTVEFEIGGSSGEMAMEDYYWPWLGLETDGDTLSVEGIAFLIETIIKSADYGWPFNGISKEKNGVTIELRGDY